MKIFMIGLLSLFLASCETIFGVPASQLDTANKNLAAATIQITSATRLTTSLVQSGTITPAQAREVQSGLQTALATVKTATDAVAVSGDPSQAVGALDIASTAIELALRLLSGFTGQDVSLNREQNQNDFEHHAFSPRGHDSFEWSLRRIEMVA